MLKIQVKPFSELTLQELYYILQLRSEVFVVEQNCVYKDIDGKDEKALHVLGWKNNKIMYFILFIRISFLKINYYLSLLQFFLKYTKNVYIIKNLFLID